MAENCRDKRQETAEIAMADMMRRQMSGVLRYTVWMLLYSLSVEINNLVNCVKGNRHKICMDLWYGLIAITPNHYPHQSSRWCMQASVN